MFFAQVVKERTPVNARGKSPRKLAPGVEQSGRVIKDDNELRCTT